MKTLLRGAAIAEMLMRGPQTLVEIGTSLDIPDCLTKRYIRAFRLAGRVEACGWDKRSASKGGKPLLWRWVA